MLKSISQWIHLQSTLVRSYGLIALPNLYIKSWIVDSDIKFFYWALPLSIAYNVTFGTLHIDILCLSMTIFNKESLWYEIRDD